MKKAGEFILTKTTIQRDAKEWLNILRYNESGTIVQFQNDSVYRVPQLLNNKKLLKTVLGAYYRKYLLGYVYLGKDDLIEEIKKTLLQLIERRNLKIDKKKLADLESILSLLEEKGLDVGIFVSNVREIFSDKKKYMQLYKIESILRKHRNFSMIVFSSIDISNDKYVELVNNCSSLFTHIIYYPLYSIEDSLKFVDYNCALWNMSLSKEQKNRIIFFCGGYFWLIRQVIRFKRDNPSATIDQIYSHELLFRKVDAIWKKLAPEERTILQKIALSSLNQSDKRSHEYAYLKTIHMVKEKTNRTEIGIPLLIMSVNKEIKMSQILAKNGSIFYNNKNIAYDLTPSELKIFQLLLENKDKLVRREDIARLLWGDKWEDKYSDWAIDRLIFRLRKRITDFNLDKNIIKTVKSRGFIYG